MGVVRGRAGVVWAWLRGKAEGRAGTGGEEEGNIRGREEIFKYHVKN